MFWTIVSFLGGVTFVQTGYSVLTDPSCQRVSVSGFRFFTTTCTTQGHGLPTVVVGVISILIGLALSFVGIVIVLGMVITIYENRAVARITKNTVLSEEGEETLENRVEKKKAQIRSIGFGSVIALIFLLFVGTFIEREVKVSHYRSVMNNVSVCNEALSLVSNFNQNFNAAGAANDRQTQIDELNAISAGYQGFSSDANNPLKSILIDEANAYSLFASAAANNDDASMKKAEAILNADSTPFVSACLPK